MTSQELKRIDELIERVNYDLETEAINSGINPLSIEFAALKQKAKELVLEKSGFTQEQYVIAKANLSALSQEDLANNIIITNSLKEEVEKLKIPTSQEIEDIAYEIAKTFIKPPQITNQIIKETTIEKPQIIKEVTIKETVREENYNEAPMLQEIDKLSQKIDEYSSKNEAKMKSLEEWKKEWVTEFGVLFKKNIDILGMPNFRKLAMGLQEQIDYLFARSIATTSSTIDDSNVDFVFTRKPTLLVINGGIYKETGGAYTWTWNPASKTATLNSPVGTGGSIFGL